MTRSVVASPRPPRLRTARRNDRFVYPASGGYVAYRYRLDPERKRLEFTVATSGTKGRCHVLLPEAAAKAVEVIVNGAPRAFSSSRVEHSIYVDFELDEATSREIAISYS